MEVLKTLQVEIPSALKQACVAAAKADGRTLKEWVIRALRRTAEQQSAPREYYVPPMPDLTITPALPWGPLPIMCRADVATRNEISGIDPSLPPHA